MKNRKGVVLLVISMMSLTGIINSFAVEKYDTVELAYSGSGPWTMDYYAAIEKAKKEDKNLFVVFTGSDWCKCCKILENQTLSQPGFIENITNDFVLVFMDKPSGRELKAKIPADKAELRDQLLKKFKIKGFPTFVLMTPDEHVYHKKSGASNISPETFAKEVIGEKKASLERIRIEKLLTDSGISTEKRIELLDKLLGFAGPEKIMTKYRELLDKIIALDVGNKYGMEMKYKAFLVTQQAQEIKVKFFAYINIPYNIGYPKILNITDKALHEYNYTGKYYQQIAILRSEAVFGMNFHNLNNRQNRNNIKKDIEFIKAAITADPHSDEAKQLQNKADFYTGIIDGFEFEKEIKAKLADENIQGLQRVKLLLQLLDAIKQQEIFVTTSQAWSKREPYIRQIIALDPENKTGWRNKLAKYLSGHDIESIVKQH
jgi:thioredoxin-related protein